jgi:hypothetical protein
MPLFPPFFHSPPTANTDARAMAMRLNTTLGRPGAQSNKK